MSKVLVIGGARSGIAVARLLAKKGYEVYLTDASRIPLKDELINQGIHVCDEGHPDFLKEIAFEFVVKNPGIPYHVPFVDYYVQTNVKIYSEIEVAYWYSNQFTFLAITGTNGKTTTVSLLASILQVERNTYLAGNIGVPLSEIVLEHENENCIVALELSNFQLLGIETFHPFVSTITNLTPDHLDYMNSLNAYYQSKLKIYENSTQDEFFLKNIDDDTIVSYCDNIPCTVLTYSFTKDADIYIKSGCVYFKEVCLFSISILPVIGDHNVMNAMVAASMAYLCGISIPAIEKGLRNFRAVEHRLEFVEKIGGVQFYNDSKATNPESVIPALQAFEGNIILLAGGYDKQLSFDVLKPFAQRVKLCISFGQTKNQFTPIFNHVSVQETLEDAFVVALANAQENDVILLSPGCASYDQFKSYEERGDVFKKLVHSYLKEENKC